MPANYLDLRDDPITLSAANPSFTFGVFNAPSIDIAERSVLMFRVAPITTPAEIEFNLNGHLHTVSYAHTPHKTWHEIFSAGDLLAANNQLTLTWHSGTAEVGDVLMWYTS